jgi:predicted dehydrogenase
MARKTRRSFLQWTGAGLAGLSLTRGGLARAEAAKSGRKYRVAVIGRTGRGDYGHHLDEVWKHFEQAEIVAVADESEKGRADAATRLGVSRTYADYREMLAKEKPQIVSIAPRQPDCHRDMALACAEAGCHVFLEKPMCRSLVEADEIVAAFDKKGLKAAMAHQTHYGPALDRVREIIAQGRIGDLVEIRGRGKEEMTRGGGEDLIVLGVHVLDLMRVLAGDPQDCSARVLADGKPVTRANVREDREGLGPIAGDEIHISYRFDKGVMGYFSTRRSRDGAGSRYGVQIFGTKGVLSMGMGAATTVTLLESPTWTPSADEAARAKELSIPFSDSRPEPEKEALGNQLIVADLLHAIETDTQPKCSARDGRWTIEMIMAAYESQRLNAPVSFPLKERRHPLTLL